MLDGLDLPVRTIRHNLSCGDETFSTQLHF